MEPTNKRREFLCTSAGLGAGVLLAACGGGTGLNQPKHTSEPSAKTNESSSKPDKNKMGGEVTATEDLMREHGILRRALLVYSAAAIKLRGNPAGVAPDALQKTAKLFRAFGEEYHERQLEEAFIFPAVKRAGGEAASYADLLVLQHNRGREITDYIIGVTQTAKLGANNSDQLAKTLEGFVLMYRHHAAREDTIIFPAWKQTMTGAQLDEMSEKFEDIEHQQFGDAGFDDAVKQIGEIESSLGLADIAQFTAPPPRSVK